MIYLLGQILFCLLLAAFIGAWIGWWVKSYLGRRRGHEGIAAGSGNLVESERRAEQRVAEFRTKHELLSSEVAPLESHLQEAREALEQARAETRRVESEWETRFEMQRDKLIGLKKRLEDKATELDRAGEESRKLRERSDETRKAKAALEAALQKSEEALAARITRVSELESQLDEKQQHLLAAQEKTTQASEAWKTEHEAQQRGAEAVRLEVARREETISSLRHQIQELSHKLSVCEEGSRRSLTQQQETEAVLRGQITEAEMSGEKAREAFDRQKDRIGVLETQLSSCQNELRAAQGRAAQQGDGIAELRVRPVKAAKPRRKSPLRDDVNEPAALPAQPSPEGKDDLKRIRGVGPVLERFLNNLGVFTYRQIANWTDADINGIAGKLNVFPGRIRRDNWVGGARALYRAKYGRPASSRPSPSSS